MLKVCIADDEEFVLKSIEQRIEQSGLEVMVAGTARNGIEAYELYEREMPDIFYVDINMPICNGLEFVERVRKLDKNSITKFIIISGYDDFIYMKRAICASVVNYIMKPILQQEFMDTLKEVCENLEELKARQLEGYGKQWELFSDYIEKYDTASGTMLLMYAENLMESLKKTAAEKGEMFIDLFPDGQWDIVRFRGCSHMLLILGENMFMTEEGIYNIWKHIEGYGETYVVYKSGNNLDMSESMNEMEVSLNRRFWKGSLHIMRSEKAEESIKEINLEHLNKAIENLQEENVECELEKVFLEVFSERKNKTLLKSFYHSVLILAANKYVSYNFEIPEKLKAELYPFTLENCVSLDDVKSKIHEFMKLIHEKIVHTFGKNELVEQVIFYLETHYTEDISLTDVASKFFVVPNYVAKKFKEKKNITAMQYLENYRMQKAEELLKKTDLSVSKIAGRVGYNDANYFTRAFKKKYKMSPREFRK